MNRFQPLKVVGITSSIIYPINHHCLASEIWHCVDKQLLSRVKHQNTSSMVGIFLQDIP